MRRQRKKVRSFLPQLPRIFTKSAFSSVSLASRLRAPDHAPRGPIQGFTGAHHHAVSTVNKRRTGLFVQKVDHDEDPMEWECSSSNEASERSRMRFVVTCFAVVAVIDGSSPLTVSVPSATRHRRRDSTSSCCRSSPRLFASATEGTTPPSPQRGSRGRVNGKVREMMELFTNRFDDDDEGSGGGDWSKTRRYLYQATAAKHHTGKKLTTSQVRNVLEWLQRTFPDDANLQRFVLQSSPRILSRHVRNNLQPTAEFLRSLYGDELLVRAVQRNPDLLLTAAIGYQGDELDLVEVFLRRGLLFRDASVAKLKRTAPFVFSLSVVKLLKIVDFLKEALLLATTSSSNSSSRDDDRRKVDAAIEKVIVSHPQILQLSVEDNLKPRIEYLQKRCGFRNEDVAALIRGPAAGVLGLSVKDNLQPKLDLLSELLPTTTTTTTKKVRLLGKAILAHPQILGLSLQNLQNKILYFDAIDDAPSSRTTMNVTKQLPRSESLASRVLLRSPAVYSLSLRHNVIPTVEYLARIWGTVAPHLEWTESELIIIRDPVVEDDESSSGGGGEDPWSSKHSLASLLSEYPGILSLSLSGNIQPTVKFLHRANYLPLDENGCLQQDEEGKCRIIRGRYIAASLFQRLLPRWHYYHTVVAVSQQHQQEEEGGEESDPTTIPLHVLASATDAAFCEQYGIDYDEYCQYKKESIPRLKFSSQFDTWLQTGRPIDVS